MKVELGGGGLCRGELGNCLEQVLPAAAKSQSRVNEKTCWRSPESGKSEGSFRQLGPQDRGSSKEEGMHI